jgi:hypothetical protein
VDRETRSSILPVRTRYRFSSVVERRPPKPDVDCSIQSAGANVFSCLGGPLAGTQRATVVLRYEFALHHLAFVRNRALERLRSLNCEGNRAGKTRRTICYGGSL